MSEQGSVMLMTLALLILLVSLAGGFLYAAGVFIGNSGWEETDAQVLWLAEAGMQRAVWNLKTPAGSGGQGESWTTAGTTQSLGAGSYTMVVEAWDFALASNSSTATAKTFNGTNTPGNAIDNSTATFWESGNTVTTGGSGNSEHITIAFPYTLTLNKVHFIVPSGSSANIPKDYQWQVSSDGSSFTTVGTPVTGNSSATPPADTFSVAANPAAANVNHLRLLVTRTNTNNRRARVATLEAIGSRVTSTGTITVSGNNYTRSVRQAFVTDSDGPQTEVAYKEPDWSEL